MSNRLAYRLELNTDAAYASVDQFIARVRERIARDIEGNITAAIGRGARAGGQAADTELQRALRGAAQLARARREHDAETARRQARMLADEAARQQAAEAAARQNVRDRWAEFQRGIADAARSEQELADLRERQAIEANRAITAANDASRQHESDQIRSQMEQESRDLRELAAEEARSENAARAAVRARWAEFQQGVDAAQREQQHLNDLRQQQAAETNRRVTGEAGNQSPELAALRQQYQQEEREAARHAQQMATVQRRQDAALRQIQNYAATRVAHIQQNQLDAERFAGNQRLLLQATIERRRAEMAGATSAEIMQMIQAETDLARRRLATLEAAARRAGGYGFGSLNNNLYQFGQAIEDFNVGYQLNGLIGGLRGASNNIAFLAAQLGGSAGLITTLGLTAAQVALFAYQQYQAKEDTKELSKELEKQFGAFEDLTTGQLDYLQSIRESGTSKALDGLKDFIDIFDSMREKQKAAFASQDAITSVKQLEIVRDVLISVASAQEHYNKAVEHGKHPYMQYYTQQLAEKQAAYADIAQQLDLPALDIDIQRYVELRNKVLSGKELSVADEVQYKKIQDTIDALTKSLEKAEQKVKETAYGKAVADEYAKIADQVRKAAQETEKLSDVENKTIEEAIAAATSQRDITVSQLLKEISDLRGEQQKFINNERLRLEYEQAIEEKQKRIVALFEDTNDVVKALANNDAALVEAEKERVAAVKQADDILKDLTEKVSTQRKEAESAVQAEERKVEAYKKQLQLLSEQRATAQLTGAFGELQGQENIQTKAVDEQIKQFKKQADAYKEYLKAQADYQSKAASAFGGHAPDTTGLFNLYDQQVAAQIEQMQQKQKQIAQQFNQKREQLLKAEVQAAEKKAAVAGTPEEQTKAFEHAIKLQEELRQLQLSQTGEGGVFGKKKLKEYVDAGKALDDLYAKQIKAIEQAQAAAENEKAVQEEKVKSLAQGLELLDNLKKQLGDKDIIKDMDVQRAQQIAAALTAAAAAQELAKGGTGLVQSLLGGLLGGFFADGGRFDGNKPIVVGEKGPEIIMPSASGLVLTNQQSKSLMASVYAQNAFGGGRGNTNVTTAIRNVNITAAPVVSANNLERQLRNSKYSARTRKR